MAGENRQPKKRIGTALAVLAVLVLLVLAGGILHEVWSVRAAGHDGLIVSTVSESGESGAESAAESTESALESAVESTVSASESSAESAASSSESIAESTVSASESAAESIPEEPADTTPPVISGANDTAILVGTPFDVMEGVTVTDDTDEAPALAVSAGEIDTSYADCKLLTYTATDAAGNETNIIRQIIVAEQVSSWEGGTYPVHWDQTGIEGQPYLIAVNRSCNTVTVYRQDDNGMYTIPDRAFVCSVGTKTPSGYYQTKERYRWRELYESSFGQYATRIVDHILFHSVPYHAADPSTLEYDEYNLLGTSASLGCVRLCVVDVKWIYDNCPEGFPCAIYDDEWTPGPLGKPEVQPIDLTDERRGWDPTDPDANNPWRQG